MNQNKIFNRLEAAVNKYAGDRYDIPEYIFVNRCLYREMLTEFHNNRITMPSKSAGANFISINTSLGSVRVKPIKEIEEDFILVGHDRDYKNYILGNTVDKILLGYE